MKPTKEQEICLDYAGTGRSLKIEAGAGTGKTSTLTMIGNMKRNGGLYIAFNKSIADEAGGKFGSSALCKTAHSLAYAQVGRHYRDRLNVRLTPDFVAQYLGVSQLNYGKKIASACMASIKLFCYSGNAEIEDAHYASVVNVVEKMDKTLFQKGNEVELKAAIKDMAEYVIDFSRQLWDAMSDYKKTIPITHDVYLKLWCLSKPQLNFKYIMFDEYQDANPVLIDLVKNQFAQKIYVGDRFQSIYGWRGAENGMETTETELTGRITQSFRFGPAVADVANKVLSEYAGSDDFFIAGLDSIDSKLATVGDGARIYRTNSALLGDLIKLVSDGMGSRIYVAGGVNQVLTLANAIIELKETGKCGHPELCDFESHEKLCEYADSDEGGDLKPLMNAMEKYGESQIISALERVKYNKAESAAITLSTAHKSKGLEWDNVWLADDFKYPKEEGQEIAEEEGRLLYVAVTRARKNLDIGDCTAVQRIL